MFPILLGKIKELEDKIKDIVIPEPYDPTSNIIILHNDGEGAMDMKWKDINNAFKNGKQIYIIPSEFTNFPQNENGRAQVNSVYQYAVNSFLVIAGNTVFSATNENYYPVLD